MRQKRYWWLNATLIALVVLGMGISLFPVQQAQAQTCRNFGVYTSYWQSKPAIWIQGGSVRPAPNRMTIYYYNGRSWEVVPSPSDWGVRTDAPQVENPGGNGWYTYFIATRWISLYPSSHAGWNDDWRWSVKYC